MIFFIRRSEKKDAGEQVSNGMLGIGTIILFLIYLFRQHISPTESMILFTIAISGALLLTAEDMSEEHIPKWLENVHKVLSLTGIFYLFFFTHTNP